MESGSGFRSPNADKFLPNCVSIRTGPLATISDLIDFCRYRASLAESLRFSLIFDDRVNEEVQSDVDCSAVDLGIGLGCEFVYVKGCGKPEKTAKILHYAAYMRASTE